MDRRIAPQDITWFLDANRMGRLDLEPSYQRRSVWTRRDRQFFLDTIFNNYPSPPVFLHKDIGDRGETIYRVVDGKQRLETILSFVDNKLPLRHDFGDDRLDGQRWKKISEDMELKRRFSDYQITVEFLDSVETTVVNEVFGRLNRNSRKLMPQEIRHAKFEGWFISRAEQESELPVWRDWKIATAGRFKRMQDIQFISELMAMTISGGVLGFDQDLIDEYYATYEYPEDLESEFDTEAFSEQFEGVKAFLTQVEEISGGVTRFATNLTHFYSLWSVALAVHKNITPEDFSAAYETFMSEFAEVELRIKQEGSYPEEDGEGNKLVRRYLLAARGASTDLGPRTVRRDSLLEAIAGGRM